MNEKNNRGVFIALPKNATISNRRLTGKDNQRSNNIACVSCLLFISVFYSYVQQRVFVLYFVEL